jgi:hypothetical protein
MKLNCEALDHPNKVTVFVRNHVCAMQDEQGHASATYHVALYPSLQQ